MLDTCQGLPVSLCCGSDYARDDAVNNEINKAEIA